MITDLRNPCMKAEHWKSLESVVGTSLNVEELTVAVLEEINVFSYGMEIQEVTYKNNYRCELFLKNVLPLIINSVK